MDDRAVTTVVYRERANRGQWAFNMIFVLCGIVIVGPEIFDYWDTGTADWDVLLFTPLIVFLLFTMNSGDEKGPSSLKLDDQGLTYAYRLITRYWTWAELSAPEIRHPNDPIGRYILLRPKRPIDWKARAAIPAVKARGSELRIHSIFDAPLTDICAKLNDYRDRALGGPAVAPNGDGQVAPNPRTA